MAEGRRSDTPFRDEAAQQALGAVLGANPFVRLDPAELLATAGRVGLAAARPGLLARHARHLGRELSAIASGRSEVRPGRGDRRFSDTTWTEMALYRGLMQGYLAASSEVQHLIDDVGVDDRERARARFLATIATEALAPTNLLAGNPAALKRTLETGGANLARGVRHWVGDLLHNGGMPRQVDTRPFVLGKTVAVSPGSVVHRNDQLELVQYRPTTERVRARPIVIIPPQINKFWVFDLAPGRSMVEHATLPAEGDQVQITERAQGEVSRQLFLGQSLDRDHLTATCENGVLTITIPMAEQAKPRRVKVLHIGGVAMEDLEMHGHMSVESEAAFVG